MLNLRTSIFNKSGGYQKTWNNEASELAQYLESKYPQDNNVLDMDRVYAKHRRIHW